MAGSYVTNAITYQGITRSLMFDWYVYSQSIAGNYSVIRWKLQGWGQTSLWVNAENFTQTVGPNTYSSSTRRQLRYGTVIFGVDIDNAGETIVYHDAQGKANFSARSGAAIGNYGSQNSTGSNSWTLPTIARASSISSVVATEIGSVVTVNISRASTVFVHKVWYRMPGQGWVLVTENAGANATFTLPMSACNYLPNSTNGSLEIAVQTMYGGKPIGGEQRATKNVKVPESVVPSFTSMTVSESVTEVSTLIGTYVQNKSRTKTIINGAKGSYGSTITQFTVDMVGNYQSHATNNEFISNVITRSGDFWIYGIVTDSRGRTFSRSVMINLLEYEEPTIKDVQFLRSSSDGTPNPMGDYVRVQFKSMVHSLMVGATEKNKLNYKVLSKRTSESNFITKTNNNHNELEYDSYVVIVGYPQDYAYNFVVRITDVFGQVSVSGLIAIGEILMQWHRNAMSIGVLMENTDYNLLVASKGIRNIGPMRIHDFPVADFIIETGSNSNGTYEKYYSGRLVQYHHISFSNPATPSPWGSSYYLYANPASWTFPIPFVIVDGLPYVDSKPDGATLFIDTITATYANSIYQVRPVSTGFIGGRKIIKAEGRWK